jgi:nitroreductase/NAD-dependent dihydropyrimidine dehydrogenase PreA subunit
MGLLSIDHDRCKRDGFCVRECPVVIIRLPEEGYPELVEGGEAGCIRCGHCVAVCPHDALDHADVPIQASPGIRDVLNIDAAQAEQFLRSRRSVRVFKAKPVEKEKIRKLIEVARYAPTGGNSQMIEWVAITDKSRLKKIAGLTADWVRELAKDPKAVAAAPYLSMIVAAWDAGFDSVLRNAPAIIAASVSGAVFSGQIDATIAMTYLDLMAPALGLGTCWAGLLQGAMTGSPSLKAEMGIPADHPYHYPMMVGYNNAKYYRVPERKAPKIVFI